ncbi:MAG: hypothetical protein JW915_04810 [Chitinispirillaceae bacterium]|nr:hypothetical protein [Chitinispirillaceae bacterium]
MIRMKRNISRFLVVALVAMSPGILQAEMSAQDSVAFQEYLDSVGVSRSDLEAKVQSTLMFGGSSPVSFSGEGRFKFQFHQFADYPTFMKEDRTWLQSNWEGNESAIRLGMVARAGRNTVLWSKIGFQNTLPGLHRNNKEADLKNDGFTAQGLHHKDNAPAIIHEDMCAGIAVRTVPASFWLKMGGVHWVEASPLTIWKSQPRTFAWEYLPFEVEQPIARYFEYNIAKGEKSGRAAWNKKAFQGINFESINLPGNLYFNFIYGTYERYDNDQREYFDFSNDYALADHGGALKAQGVGDWYRRVFHARVAARELLGRITPSLNLMVYTYDHEIWKNKTFQKHIVFPSDNKKMFYKEPVLASFELRGPINEKLSIHTDFAFGNLDTTWIYLDNIGTDTNGSAIEGFKERHNRSPLSGAFYTRLESKYLLPVNMDVAIIGKNFYSPLSFSPPVDAFFPFGANLLGPGKFIGRGEASPYIRNMAGINFQVVPELPGYGHLKFNYGQHFQLQEARDLIYFPYRLNGQDLFSSFHSSYNRWGNEGIATSLRAPINERMGDVSFRTEANENPLGFEGGGLRSDYLAMYDGFVAYENIDQAKGNLANYDNSNFFFENKSGDEDYVYAKGPGDTLKSKTAFVPHHQKFTFNFDADWAYDFGAMLGYPRDLFFSAYFALNGVSTSFTPIAFNDKSEDMLLWGTYLRLEPAIALTKKFYLLGLAGFENWRSQKSYQAIKDPVSDVPVDVYYLPIDYRDYAVGLGFDWDMLARVGLHGRFKYMWHDDINYMSNCYKGPVISTEIKMWF